MTTGWKLDRTERAALLRRFPPRYPDADADHVTLQAGASGPVPSDLPSAEIVGHADDETGLECMVVRLKGTTDRPDGSTYHITWSLDQAAGRRAAQSNDVLRTRGWAAFDAPVPISLTGAVW